MENQSATKDFHIVAFSSNEDIQLFLFVVFLSIYLIGLLGNLIIITVTCKDTQLHTPMYFFLCNLSFIDICYTTVTIPKLMDILLTGNNLISFVQCFTQMFFFIFVGSIEVVLLSSMAYDRYVAICNPLQYYLIMNQKKCALILIGIWIPGCFNSCIVTFFASKLSLCHSNKIQHFFCNVKALAQIACANVGFDVMIYVEILILGLFPLLISFASYTKIIKIILSIKTTNGRRKAFSTCTSHLMVLIIFYGTILFMYMRPTSQDSDELDQVFSVLYAAVAPMLNPLIYSLRNKEVKHALMRIVGMKSK
ncbi:olfactory receptor 8H1-like [Spea bombifrons]|uniref:olfactory receptor 8H1-like n=1 Tax=Spea bombifrons TaxID=233779 RepID=UPI00234B27B0|nr:olfactory receptor 8H1-like [Spea bombifrons]